MLWSLNRVYLLLYILTTFCNFLLILQCSASSHESASAVPSCISEARSYIYSTSYLRGGEEIAMQRAVSRAYIVCRKREMRPRMVALRVVRGRPLLARMIDFES